MYGYDFGGVAALGLRYRPLFFGVTRPDKWHILLATLPCSFTAFVHCLCRLSKVCGLLPIALLAFPPIPSYEVTKQSASTLTAGSNNTSAAS